MNIFSDQEIHDRCLAECRLDYLECRANCDSSLCDSGCLAKFQGDFRVVKDSLIFSQSAKVPVRVDWTVPLAAEIVKNTRSAKMNAKTRSSTTKNTKVV
jgi:hypothetical protein